jgi:hypothetical protein
MFGPARTVRMYPYPEILGLLTAVSLGSGQQAAQIGDNRYSCEKNEDENPSVEGCCVLNGVRNS